MREVIVIGLGADYGPSLRRVFIQHLAVAEPSLLRIHGCETESSVVIISDILEQKHETGRIEEMLIKNITEHFTEISILVHDPALYEQSPTLPSCCTPRIAKAIVHSCQYCRIRPPPLKSGRFFIIDETGVLAYTARTTNNDIYMGKRDTSLGAKKKSTHSHKTQKRLAIKKEMLAERASKKKSK